MLCSSNCFHASGEPARRAHAARFGGQPSYGSLENTHKPLIPNVRESGIFMLPSEAGASSRTAVPDPPSRGRSRSSKLGGKRCHRALSQP
jgi:hypothetical protein